MGVDEPQEDMYERACGLYEADGVDRLTETRVVAIDTPAHRLALGSGQELEYQKLLVATGGRNRRLTVPGAGLPGIHYLRTAAECDAIKREAAAGRRAVVVGMGFIGCEVTASLTQLGVHVTSVFPGKIPLERVLGEQVGAIIGAMHRSNGVRLLAGAQVAAFEGSERLEAAVTADGERMRAYFSVAGLGLDPDLPPFAGSALA